MAESEPKSGIVKFPDVLERELVAIATRRKRAGLEDSPGSSTTTAASEAQPPAISAANTPEARAASMNLIGLALSGGGIRSASFCLGVLQGLHRRGVLPLIDYLSTVSGGGYAGAYLSSSALGSEPPSSAGAETAAFATERPRPAKRLDAALGAGAEQPQRVRELIGNGNFLLRNKLSGMNRSFFGMLLIWAFVGSGLFALTSLAAFLYRCLDAMPCRQFLAVLGIADQLSLDLFPPLVMFLIYLLVWLISYWQSGRAARGLVTRWWLVATAAVTLVALAKLMGSGNITVDAVAGVIGDEPSRWIHDLFAGSSLPTLIYGAIAASLLPYFAPARLFRSGGDGQSGVQRVMFTIASWALLAGVPFLLVAYFAHEGIGGGQRLADDRLRVPQVKDWRKLAHAPLWSGIKQNYLNTDPLATAASSPSKAEPGLVPTSTTVTDPSAATKLWLWVNWGSLDEKNRLEPESGGLFGELEELHGELAKYTMRKSLPVEDVLPDAEWSWPTTQLSILTRWYHLIEYSLGYALGLDTIDQYQFALMLNQRQQIQELKERIVFRMNQRLLRPDFYNDLPLPPLDPKDEWSRKVHGLRREAAALARTVEESSGKWRFRVKDFNNTEVHAINGGNEDTPWLVELRPRWAVLPDNVEEELSKHRGDLNQTRIREEQSFYPEAVYPRTGLESPNHRSETTGDRDRIERTLPPPLPLIVRSRIAAAQTDSVYVAKPWRQVRGLDSLGEFAKSFRKKLPPNVDEDPSREVGASPPNKELNREETEFQMLWLPLLPQAWHELPWQSAASTTLRDVDRELQVALTTDADKMRRVLATNRKLLEAYFPDTILPRTEKFSYILLERDQVARWSWFCWSLGCFLVLGLVLDLNATSWHGYYAERIGSAWIQPAAGLGRQIPLGQLRTVEEGLPYHLITGSLNPFRRPIGNAGPTDLFLLSQQFVGSELTGYRATGDLHDDNYNLASAVAISGGAVNPLHAHNPLQKALLLLGNVRLGQWIQNPGYGGSRWKVLEKFRDTWPITPFRFFAMLVRSLDSCKYCFVTDGGLTENLGIKQLLLRRCKLILAVDAAQDEKFQFHDLSKLLRWMQVDQGIRVTWQSVTPEFEKRAKDLGLGPVALSLVMSTGSEDKSAAVRDKSASRRLNPDAVQHHLLARIEYPGYADAPVAEREKFVGYLVYLKSTLCRNDPVELLSYQQAHPQFPHDPTSDFAFDRDQFESYRQLGEITVESTLKAVTKELAETINGSRLIEAIRAGIEASATAGSMGDGAPKPQGTVSVSVAPTSPLIPDERRAKLEEHKITVLKNADLWARKGAAHEFEDVPEMRDQIIEALVVQLDHEKAAAADHAHIVLLEFHEAALPMLRRGIEYVNERSQIRRVRVIADILQEHFDRPTVEFLLDWLEKPASPKVQNDIQEALQRIPRDRYPGDAKLEARVSAALLLKRA